MKSIGKVELLGLRPQELTDFLGELGQPPYRAKQLFSWLHRGVSLSEMSDLPRALRERLAKIATVSMLELVSREAATDGAIKLGLRTVDGHLLETVIIPHARRTTVCVSSQIGCAYGCLFCATGTQKLIRDATAGEIVEQVIQTQRIAKPARISNVVFMGMGEPLANYEAVVRAIRLLNHPDGLNIAARHIAVSTCGLPDQIRRLAGEGLQIALAISLHGATDQVRSRIVPINRKYPIAEVMAAAREYADRTGRKLTFQYVVAPGLNDTPEQGKRLAGLMRGLPYMINLIPQNPTSGGRPDPRAAIQFAQLLQEAGLEVAIRRSRGAEVLGACGQLRERVKKS